MTRRPQPDVGFGPYENEKGRRRRRPQARHRPAVLAPERLALHRAKETRLARHCPVLSPRGADPAVSRAPGNHGGVQPTRHVRCVGRGRAEPVDVRRRDCPAKGTASRLHGPDVASPIGSQSIATHRLRFASSSSGSPPGDPLTRSPESSSWRRASTTSTVAASLRSASVLAWPLDPATSHRADAYR
jgi:hypothetical protein